MCYVFITVKPLFSSVLSVEVLTQSCSVLMHRP